MRRFIVRAACVGIASATAAAVGRPMGMSAQPAAAYSVTYFGGLGGNHSRGNSINDVNWVSGYSQLAGNTVRHATLWSNGVPIDLGTLGSPQRPKNSNVVWPVKNNIGLLVGISQTDSPDPWSENWSCAAFFTPGTEAGYRCVGFVWEGGRIHPLPTLGGTHGFAAAANNHRQIVGWAENQVRDGSCTRPQIFQFRAVVWGPDGHQIHELPILKGDSASAATAINNRGQIVGISGACDDAVGSATAAHMVLWDHGTIEEIPNLGGKEWNTPTAINEQGEVAGFSDRVGDTVTEAYFWSRTEGLVPIGFMYADHGLSEAFGLNDRKQVVGLSCGSECRAFLWENGVMHDLNTLIPTDPTMLLTHAMDINNDGVITGRATVRATGERVTFVASPTHPSLALGGPNHRPPATRLELSPESLREILHPLGPGVNRLGRHAVLVADAGK